MAASSSEWRDLWASSSFMPLGGSGSAHDDMPPRVTGAA
eukprot:CAMPEP_0181219646 /NCGR_PEP_ID=MMETSP1096-20121128/28399_1 /TAXON_ID=156174 ORGANISM="Chrysochromulina ericina, Strain CCMP281" /NCGR_SAMPLE_ID=MMETSP1096 /ASSEMBLY_ACC=CAM_ASM_000453 /LENGTH=38 /DNA_ID= /DNA_START= /DNA_END= /DNA_ORIENTATION=